MNTDPEAIETSRVVISMHSSVGADMLSCDFGF